MLQQRSGEHGQRQAAETKFEAHQESATLRKFPALPRGKNINKTVQRRTPEVFAIGEAELKVKPEEQIIKKPHCGQRVKRGQSEIESLYATCGHFSAGRPSPV